MSNKKEPHDIFYHNVRVRATELGINMLNLSMKMGKTPSFTSTNISKGSSPTLSLMCEYAEALNTTVAKLTKGI